ncbi:MAG: HAD-IC family P-type ATPase [Clostridia bacterium]|nr:HAD-IC family P-type ATPase [Clostridia bacterium]
MKKKQDFEKGQIVRIDTDANVGLNDEQVLDRIINGHSNIPVESPSKTVGQIIASNVFTYFNLIFFVLAILMIVASSYNDLMFMPVVLVNILIGVVQEINAKRTLDKLQLLNTPVARVVRNGEEIETNVENLVIDDIAVLGPGDQLSADAVVVSGKVSVNESLVTGESDEIFKKEGDSLLSGSFVVSGKCRARITCVGHDSFVARLTLDAKKTKKRKKKGMMLALSRLIMVIGILIIPIGAALFLSQMYRLGMAWDESLVKMAGALIGMIPEGLYLLTSIALAVSVIRLAKKRTLVHELGCIEMLARVDVLCLDKTGTITENEMQVDNFYPIGDDRDKTEQIISDVVSSLNADNNTMIALKERFTHDVSRRVKNTVPFSSVCKFSAVNFENGESYLLGAPEFVLSDGYESHKERIEALASAGARVLALALSDSEVKNGERAKNVTLKALITLSNPIRADAAETFSYFAEQGVEIKVISGDNPITVASAAKKAGIANCGKYVDVSVLSDSELYDAAGEYTVFGRVSPEQKKKLILCLKKQGHTVAMTGDGVNDVLALKEADCSIAMASGSDVASQVSHIVLLDSNFASMPSVVSEGRRVINNIERSASLFLVKNIFSFVMAWITILAALEYPLEPSQLTLVNAFTIGIPSFVLALEANKSRVRGKFIRNILFRAAPAGLTNVILILTASLFARFFTEFSASELSTVSVILMATVGFMMLWRVSMPFNLIRGTLFGAMVAGFAGTFVLLGQPLFSVSPLSREGLLVLAVLMALAFPIYYALHSVFYKTSEVLTVLKGKITHKE